MRTSETLRAAKHYIIEHGWFQGALKGSKGQACAIGAIEEAAGDFFGSLAARRLFGAVATGRDAEVAVSEDGIADWNDDEARTLQEVLDAFDASIIIAEQQETQDDALQGPGGGAGVSAPRAEEVGA